MKTVEEYKKQLETCKASVREKTDFVPKLALILGSGLGGFAEQIQQEITIPYNEIEGFPLSTVEGHAGQLIFGYLGDLPLVCMQGRVHYYEGYPMSQVVLPIRLLKLLGAEYLVLTNAAGGVNFNFSPGDLMLITDQISSLVPSPLIGENLDFLGTRFPDMSQIYDTKLQELVRQSAKEENIPLEEGVYLQLTGPAYESPAEVRMCRLLGADAVGMSTTCEAVAANHMGMKIAGISCITNLASGMSDAPLDHTDVQQTADRVAQDFQRLVSRFLGKVGELL